VIRVQALLIWLVIYDVGDGSHDSRKLGEYFTTELHPQPYGGCFLSSDSFETSKDAWKDRMRRNSFRNSLLVKRFSEKLSEFRSFESS
jgi:hypothetical protein